MPAGCRRARSRARSPASAGTTGSCCSRSRSAPIRPRICARRAPGRRCRSISTSTRSIGCCAQPDPTTPRGLRDKALIELLYATGLRVTELLSLRPGDINLDAGYLTCIGKGDKQRIVPLGHAAADWVRRYIARGAAGAARSGASRRGCSSMRRAAARLSRVGFWKVLKDYGIKAGVSRAS